MIDRLHPPPYTVRQLPVFAAWLATIPETATRVRLARRLDKAGRGLLGDVKPVGGGVYEMREDFGPGWRMYYTRRRNVLVVMLAGGDKSTQPRDIARAIELAAALED